MWEKLVLRTTSVPRAVYMYHNDILLYAYCYLQENQISNDENDYANCDRELIIVLNNTGRSKQILSGLQVEVKERGDLVSNYEKSFGRNHIVIERKQMHIDTCNGILANLLEKREVSM